MNPQEYFAWALDNGPRDPGEPRQSGGDGAFAEELGLAARLRMLGARYSAPGSEPTVAERARMRARILGSLPDGATPSQPPDTTRRTRARWGFAPVMAAAVCLLIAMSSASLLFAGDALPGDPLYGIKRTMERASLTLSFGEKSDGFTHLELAGNRVDEIEALAAQEPAAKPTLFVETFHVFRSDAAAGSRALTDAGTNAAASVLSSLRQWSAHERSRLVRLRAGLPAGAQPAVSSATRLLHRIIGRTDALRDRFPCRSITSGARDRLGPLPATGLCQYSPETVNPNASRTPIPPEHPEPPSPRPDQQPNQQVLAVVPPERAPAPVPAAQPVHVESPLPDPPTGAPAPATQPGHGDSELTVPLPVDLGTLDVAGVLILDLG